ncbi:MAG: spore germination protein [Bacillota bacterium]
MFGFLKRKLAALLMRQSKASEPPPQLAGKLEHDLAYFADIAGDDLTIQRLSLRTVPPTQAALVYIDSLNKQDIIGELVLQPLLLTIGGLPKVKAGRPLVELLGSSVLQVGGLAYSSDVLSLEQSVLNGDCLVLVDRADLAIILSTAQSPERPIMEPNTERPVRGPRASFTENLITNVSLLRRWMRNKDLVLERMTIGERSHTQVGIIYIRKLVQDELVQEVKHRLSRIRIDSILESGYIEQLIEDNPWSIFAQVGNSERPDVVIAKLQEGRVGIVIDGTPLVLTVPMLFAEGLQTPEDYYSRTLYSSLVRLIRFVALLVATALPALYVALVSYHQELIPTPLLVTMSATAEGTPFPAYLEMLLVILIFEIVREASLRLPANIGQAVSIVGTLVIGQAAIQAGLFGAPAIIVAALTSLSSFVITPHGDASTILRFLLTIVAGFSGLFGMLIAALFLLVHLCSLRSFGVLYLWPWAPFSASGQKDLFVRAPLWMMRQRPQALPSQEKRRFAASAKPRRDRS